MILVVALVIGAFLVTGTDPIGPPSQAGATSSKTLEGPMPQPSATELAKFQEDMTTASGRAQFTQLMNESFGKVAKVGFGPVPTTRTESTQLDAAWGYSWDHLWIIASFADVSDGALASALGACSYYAPGYWKWACGFAAWAIQHLANLRSWEAWSSSHGIWAAIYWSPWVYWTGGYW